MIIFGVALLTINGLCVIWASSVGAWTVGGIGLYDEETFVSSGSFEMELPRLGFRLINCTETGEGRIFVDPLNDPSIEPKNSNWLEANVTLSGCEVAGLESECHVEPISWKEATWYGEKPWRENWKAGKKVKEVHAVGYPFSPLTTIVVTGTLCPWFETMEVVDPDVDPEEVPKEYKGCVEDIGIKFGTEAANLPVTTHTCPPFGEHYLDIHGTSTWQLSGAHNKEKWSADVLPGPPAAKTLAASEIAPESVKLNGKINLGWSETHFHFEYGATKSYGTSIPVPENLAGSGFGEVEVSQTAANLESGKTYHYRIVATNSYGTDYGEDKTFVTPPAWTVQSTAEPAEAKGSWLTSASCSSSEACAAVGTYTKTSGTQMPLGKVKSGGNWSLTSTPSPSGVTSSGLGDVSCSGSSSCTAIGSAWNSGTGVASVFAERWNGSSWSLQTLPSAPKGTEYTLEDVACPASNDCTAVGYSTNLETGNASVLAERWNGTSWSIASMPNPEGATKSWIYGISCVSSSDCWAVGYRNKTSNALAEHWNGTAWTINSPSGFSQPLAEVSCGSSSSCVARTSESLLLARWNGSSWSQETAPTPEGASSTILNGISCTSASACMIVGWYNVGHGVPLTMAWNGSKWSFQSNSFPSGVESAFLEGTSCTSATACTAVGHTFAPSSQTKTLVEARQ